MAVVGDTAVAVEAAEAVGHSHEVHLMPQILMQHSCRLQLQLWWRWLLWRRWQLRRIRPTRRWKRRWRLVNPASSPRSHPTTDVNFIDLPARRRAKCRPISHVLSYLFSRSISHVPHMKITLCEAIPSEDTDLDGKVWSDPGYPHPSEKFFLTAELMCVLVGMCLTLFSLTLANVRAYLGERELATERIVRKKSMLDSVCAGQRGLS